MTVAPPGLLALTAPLVTVTEAVRDEVHVSGTPVIVVPLVSTTTAVRVFEPVLAKASETTGLLSDSRVICLHRAGEKSMGTLLVPPMVTNIGVFPGVLAVTFDLVRQKSGGGGADGSRTDWRSQPARSLGPRWRKYPRRCGSWRLA